MGVPCINFFLSVRTLDPLKDKCIALVFWFSCPTYSIRVGYKNVWSELIKGLSRGLCNGSSHLSVCEFVANSEEFMRNIY